MWGLQDWRSSSHRILQKTWRTSWSSLMTSRCSCVLTLPFFFAWQWIGDILYSCSSYLKPSPRPQPPPPPRYVPPLGDHQAFTCKWKLVNSLLSEAKVNGELPLPHMSHAHTGYSQKQKGWPPFPPSQTTARLSSFANIFLISPRFLLFSPTAEPGPRLFLKLSNNNVIWRN